MGRARGFALTERKVIITAAGAPHPGNDTPTSAGWHGLTLHGVWYISISEQNYCRHLA